MSHREEISDRDTLLGKLREEGAGGFGNRSVRKVLEHTMSICREVFSPVKTDWRRTR